MEEILWMGFLNKGNRMIKKKYQQLRLARQFGGITTIVYTQTLCVINGNIED